MYPFISVAYAAQEATQKSRGIPIPMVAMTVIILIPVIIWLLTRSKSDIDEKYGSTKEQDEQEDN